ncbi:probable metal-nicotianamine transporter YSL6 [Rosa chinensis]|nr:probable metal-nicotianamine transporter YSL6 [Rosa chinensis]
MTETIEADVSFSHSLSLSRLSSSPLTQNFKLPLKNHPELQASIFLFSRFFSLLRIMDQKNSASSSDGADEEFWDLANSSSDEDLMNLQIEALQEKGRRRRRGSIPGHKLNLKMGIIPSLNVAAGLLGFFFVKSWIEFLAQFGFQVKPFTRQENTVIQTCVVACYSLAFSWGFGSYLVAMDERTYKLIGEDYPGNRAEDVINPSLWWMTGFLVVVSFLGLFSLVPLRKVMVMDYKLTYPSGTATTMLINSFHTKSGAELAGKQVQCLEKYLSMSLI